MNSREFFINPADYGIKYPGTGKKAVTCSHPNNKQRKQRQRALRQSFCTGTLHRPGEASGDAGCVQPLALRSLLFNSTAGPA